MTSPFAANGSSDIYISGSAACRIYFKAPTQTLPCVLNCTQQSMNACAHEVEDEEWEVGDKRMRERGEDRYADRWSLPLSIPSTDGGGGASKLSRCGSRTAVLGRPQDTWFRRVVPVQLQARITEN